MVRRMKLVAIALAVGASVAGAPAWSQSNLEGEWEGFIHSPRRPVHIVVEFKQTDGNWQGTIDIPGARDVPLQQVHFAAPKVHFELPLDSSTFVFDGKLAGEEISGNVSQGEHTSAFSLDRQVPLPPPANRVEAWEQDLDIVLKKFLKYDRSFTSQAQKEFRRTIASLKASLPKIAEEEIIVTLSRAVALNENAHTRLYLLRNRTELRRYPIRVYWFSDGLYVVKTTSDLRETVGCRVVRIGGHDPQLVKQSVAELFAGNESWVEYKSVYFMTSPEILYGLKLIADMDTAEFIFDCGQGNTFSRTLKPLPLKKSQRPTEAWWHLSPLSEEDDREWASALKRESLSIPLYLKNPRQHYWFEYLDESRVLYFQYNRSLNMPEGESFARFSERLLQFIEQHPVERFVIDLRFNTGGNNGIAWKFMEKLAGVEKVNQRGKLFAITGRSTFSAGISHAAQLKQFTKVILVGEPVGDKLDTWSEGGNIVLPNSQLTVHFTNGFHGYSTIDYPEFKPYFQDLNIPDLEPDILVRPSSDDYFSGRDSALEAILSYPR